MKLEWNRVAAEGVVITASVLLALWVDAPGTLTSKGAGRGS